MCTVLITGFVGSVVVREIIRHTDWRVINVDCNIENFADNNRMIWVLPGFVYGFYVTSNVAEFKYTDYYLPEYERCIQWKDSAIASLGRS